ncbi:MAG TPA: hypothetical protein VMT88_03105 [Actinomycetes bacterium]|nr:hypothetical protein [Actinomycetes bacterium]
MAISRTPSSTGRGLVASLALLMLLASLLAGCGDSGTQQVKDVDELLVRTAASNQGPGVFAKYGADISGPLSCTSSQQSDGVQVSCTGTTLDGKAVQLTGTASSLAGGSSPTGSFVGTVDGQQVFSVSCLGC